MIVLLDQNTINKIAAGEVIERPSSVVKELVENAVDSGASAITVEIKEGGLSLIRITDNGSGILKEEVRQAFLRHATSKLTKAEDLLNISSLGFRGEALASIAAVAQVEIITKTKGSLTGCRYEIHGGREQAYEEIGCPEGTTLIVRNLFYNTPARKKFMKSAMTEGGYIQELVTRLAMSRPEISMQFIINGQNKLSTPGNGRLKDVIYQIYGRDITSNLLEVNARDTHIKMYGYIGKPLINRGNRLLENYFVNGRYMKNNVVTKAIEEAYRTFVMVHKFPFTAIFLELEPSLLDINVHPTKMEMRYQESEQLYRFVYRELREALLQKELIPEVSIEDKGEQARREPEETKKRGAEPFETVRKKRSQEEAVTKAAEEYGGNIEKLKAAKIFEDVGGYHVNNNRKERIHLPWQDNKPENSKEEQKAGSFREGQTSVGSGEKEKAAGFREGQTSVSSGEEGKAAGFREGQTSVSSGEEEKAAGFREGKTSFSSQEEQRAVTPRKEPNSGTPKQLHLFKNELIAEEPKPKYRLIGQLFKTYWLIEYEDRLFIMDQHAAHEKVMYEGFMRKLMNSEIYSQQLLPPKVVTLSPVEENALKENAELFSHLGFSLEPFGGREYMIRAVPEDIFGIPADDVFSALIGDLSLESGVMSEEIFVAKLSAMACKAAVKGNSMLSPIEAEALIDQLLKLENPYNCPHGRPTIISMSERELEKKFKRIQS